MKDLWAIGFESFFKGINHCPPTTELVELQAFLEGWLAAKEDSAYYDSF